jgi:BirA family transcriptional regulator, biotin operon repressor / biotin---[acetyl-CoA-carboxylase] ligase
MGNSKPLDCDAIRHGLATFISGNIHCFEECTSTNDIAKEFAREGQPDGTIILADYQSAGRGRMARSWLAPKYSSILMSIVFRPSLAPPQIPRVTMAISLGACDAIEQMTGLGPKVKWPNDLLLNGKKCAGILSEAEFTDNRVEYVVAGLGLNANFQAGSVVGIPQDATTLLTELLESVSREDLVVAIAYQIKKYYSRVQAGEDLGPEWKSRMASLGSRVSVHAGDQFIEGIAQDVDEDGALIVIKANGQAERIIAGDVTLQK